MSTCPCKAIRVQAPELVEWELTRACNLRCRHCYHDARPRRASPRASELVGWASAMVDAGVRSVSLTGGEPLLSPQWEAVASTLAQGGVLVQLISNGTLLDRHAIERARRAGVGFVWLSLDGLRRTHDWVRGGGTYDACLAAAEALGRGGMRFGFITSLLRRSAPELEEVADTISGTDAGVWQIWMAMPASERQRPLCLDPASAASIRARIRALRPPARLRIAEGDNLREAHACEAGRRVAGLDVDGRLRPCLAMPASGHGPDGMRLGCAAQRARHEGSLVPLGTRARPWLELAASALAVACAACTDQRSSIDVARPVRSEEGAARATTAPVDLPVLGARRSTGRMDPCCMSHMLVVDCLCTTWDEVDVASWKIRLEVPSSAKVDVAGEQVRISLVDDRGSPSSTLRLRRIATGSPAATGSSTSLTPHGTLRFQLAHPDAGPETARSGELALADGRRFAFGCTDAKRRSDVAHCMNLLGRVRPSEGAK